MRFGARECGETASRAGVARDRNLSKQLLKLLPVDHKHAQRRGHAQSVNDIKPARHCFSRALSHCAKVWPLEAPSHDEHESESDSRLPRAPLSPTVLGYEGEAFASRSCVSSAIVT